MQHSHFNRCLLSAVFLFSLLAGSAQAGSFGVSPVKLELPARAKSTSFTVTNNGDQPVVLRARIERWSKAEGVDKLVPARELVLTPPIFSVPAKSAQVIRVGRPLALKGPPDVEAAYRLIVNEIPVESEAEPVTADGEATTARLQLKTLLQISVPLFVAPKKALRANEWSLQAVQDEEQGAAARLWVRNSGTVHEKFTRLALRDAAGNTLASMDKGLMYALPGQESSVTLKLSRALAPAEPLTLRFESAENNREVPVQARAAGAP